MRRFDNNLWKVLGDYMITAANDRLIKSLRAIILIDRDCFGEELQPTWYQLSTFHVGRWSQYLIILVMLSKGLQGEVPNCIYDDDCDDHENPWKACWLGIAA